MSTDHNWNVAVEKFVESGRKGGGEKEKVDISIGVDLWSEYTRG